MSKTYKKKFLEAIRTTTDLVAADFEQIAPWIEKLKEGDREFYYQFMLEYYFDGGREREFSLLKSGAMTQNRNARNIDILMGGVVGKPDFELVSGEEIDRIVSEDSNEESRELEEAQIEEARLKSAINEKGTKGLLTEMVNKAMVDIGYSEEEDKRVINKLLERAVLLALMARSSGEFRRRGRKKRTAFT